MPFLTGRCQCCAESTSRSKGGEEELKHSFILNIRRKLNYLGFAAAVSVANAVQWLSWLTDCRRINCTREQKQDCPGPIGNQVFGYEGFTVYLSNTSLLTNSNTIQHLNSM